VTIKIFIHCLIVTGLLILNASANEPEGDMGGISILPSQYVTATKTNPLSSIKIRLAPPALTFGPSTVNMDTEPTFICPTPGSSPCYVLNANQAPWEIAATSTTTGYGGSDDGSQTFGTSTQTTGYGSVSGGLTSQIMAHNFNASPLGTTTLTSNWSQPLPDNTITATSPGISTNQCGSWPTSTYKVGSTWYMLVHNEGPCDYSDPLGNGQIGYTNESMSLWQSTTAAPGSWTAVTGSGSPGTIISSTITPIPGWVTGIGDSTMIPGSDGYMYVYVTFYCELDSCSYKNGIARAPMSNMAPGNWMFLYGGCFCAPALNNYFDSVAQIPHADKIPYVGSSAATMLGTPYKVLISDGRNHAYWRHYPGSNIGGIGLSISLDYKTFYTFPAPLVNYDFLNFGGRPSPDDLYLYNILRNDYDGSSTLAEGHWNLWGVYVPPNNSLGSRYLIVWPATMTQLSITQIEQGVPQMGVTLETWHNTSTGNSYSGKFRTTTVNPYAGVTSDGAVEPGWSQNSFLGYVMTNCPGSTYNVQICDSNGANIAVRIEECWNTGNDNYALQIDTNGTSGSCPSGWEHLRTIGWLYKSPQTFGTNPVYSCYNSSANYYFSSNDPACNGQTVQSLLGYALAN